MIPDPEPEVMIIPPPPGENPAEWLARRFREARDKFESLSERYPGGSDQIVPTNWDLPIGKADECVALIKDLRLELDLALGYLRADAITFVANEGRRIAIRDFVQRAQLTLKRSNP